MKRKVWPETQVLLAIPVLIFLGIIAMLFYQFFIYFIRSEKPNHYQSQEAAKRILALYPEAKFELPALVRGKQSDWIVLEAKLSKEKSKTPENTIEVIPVDGTDDFLHLVSFNSKNYYLIVSGNSPKDLALQGGEFIKWLLEEAGLPKATASGQTSVTKPKIPWPPGNPPR